MLSARVDITDSDLSKQELEDLTQSLRAEALMLDVDVVTTAPGQGGAPIGARGADADTVGALLVTLEYSLPLETALAKTVRAWLVRSEAATRTACLTAGDKSIELSGASSVQTGPANRRVHQGIGRGLSGNGW